MDIFTLTLIKPYLYNTVYQPTYILNPKWLCTFIFEVNFYAVKHSEQYEQNIIKSQPTH